MFWVDTKRIIRSGYRNFVRNGFTSFSSLIVMTITLLFFTGLLFLQVVLQTSLTNIKNQVDVAIYFTQDAPTEQILEIQKSIEKIPEVASVAYISREEALEIFRKKHANDSITTQALSEIGENPLGASLNVRAKDPAYYESIAKQFDQGAVLGTQSLNIIDKINYYQNKPVIDKLNAIIHGANRLGFLLSIVLIVISVIITFNTLRIIIFMAREEIGVMRLVGAANRYIRGPFMVSGMLVGIFSSIISILIFWPLSYWLGAQMTDFFGIDLFSYYKSNFFQIFFITLLAGIVIGGISSIFAIRKYLKK